MKTEFREQQKFNQWWLVLILVGLVLIALYAFFQQVIFGKPFGNNPAPNSFIIGFLIATVLINFGFLSLKLKTVINSKSIDVSFSIFGKKHVDWVNVVHAEVVDYGFIGGWGLRHSKKYGTVYSTNGSEGLHIKLRNGNQFIVGTQRTAELKKYLGTIVLANFN